MSAPGGPRIGRWLASLLPRHDREVIVGDLEERHAELARTSGRAAADRRYVGDLVTSIWTRGPRAWWRALASGGARDGSDVALALRRTFKRQPIASAVVVLSLAGGIGVTTATLVVREAVFVRASPDIGQPDELSDVDVGRPDRPRAGVPYELFETWSEDLPAGARIAASAPASSVEARVGDRQALVPVRPVSPDFFEVLGVGAALGTTLEGGSPGDGRAVLSHGLSLRLFDGRDDALGRTVEVGGRALTVVGVLPERFWLGDMAPTVWTVLDPRALAAASELDVVVRRPSGLTPDALRDHLQEGLDRYVARLPESDRAQRAQVWPVGGTPVARQMAFVVPIVLGTAVFLTLLIACANAAVLIFAQWTARERELAVRASLGASRGRLLRQLLVEALVFAAIGGALGLVVTFALGRIIARSGGATMSLIDLSMDAGIFAKSALIALLAGVFAGLGPALVETGRAQGNPLRAMVSERVRQRWRNALVTLEITMTVALLIVAGTLVDGYRRAFSADFGFDTESLMIARVENPAGVPVEQLRAALASIPGTQGVAAASTVPLGGGSPMAPVAAQETGEPVTSERVTKDAQLFATLGVAMREGRDFTEAEAKTGGAVAILNDSLALRLFADASPIGAQVWISGKAHEVVGVVANYSTNGLGRIRPIAFVPLAAEATAPTEVQILLRTSARRPDLGPLIRRVIQEAAPGTTATSVYAPWEIIAQGAREILTSVAPLVPLILMGLLLTSVGIYGVLAFAIARRARELATRVAMGAGRYSLMRLVAAQTFRLLLLGSALAVVATFALTRVVRAAGGGGSAFDTPSWQAFMLPVAIVLGVGMLASWIPARRALSIDPAVVLKGE